MASSKSKDGLHIFECDECGDVEGDEHSDFYKAWEDVKASGWQYLGNNIHRCDTCRRSKHDSQR